MVRGRVMAKWERGSERLKQKGNGCISGPRVVKRCPMLRSLSLGPWEAAPGIWGRWAQAAPSHCSAVLQVCVTSPMAILTLSCPSGCELPQVGLDHTAFLGGSASRTPSHILRPRELFSRGGQECESLPSILHPNSCPGVGLPQQTGSSGIMSRVERTQDEVRCALDPISRTH